MVASKDDEQEASLYLEYMVKMWRAIPGVKPMNTRPGALLAVVGRTRLDGGWVDGWEGVIGSGFEFGSMVVFEVDVDVEQRVGRP